jgi:hypothetical protein
MSIKGLWLVNFRNTSNTMFGNGVIVFESGRCLGGDSYVVYVGSYKVHNDVLEVQIKLTQYAQSDDKRHMFGDGNEYEAIVKGKYDDKKNEIELLSTAQGSDEVLIVTATRFAELP